MNLALAAWKLTFQLSPIVLTNGIATNVPGGMLPIIVFTEALNFIDGLLIGTEDIELDGFFANFEPTTGATLIDQEIGHYPFANQAVAANAVIAQPLTVSMRMLCPVKDIAGYPLKLATMMALQAALTQHNGSGGTYTVVTQSYFYTNCIMTGMRDVSSEESNQQQFIWQMDFEQPLLTLQSAQQAQNSLMSKLTGGTQINADDTGSVGWSGLSPTVGQPPSLAASSIIPSGSSAGTGVSGLSGGGGGQ
jgi:hypothetical protein